MSSKTKTTARKEEAAPALLPKLRFPEFQDAGEWKTAPLAKFVRSLDAGVSVNSGDRPAGKGELGVLKTSCVTIGVFEPNENKVVSSDLEKERLTEPVVKNTIIISRMNTPALVGANAYVEASAENLFLPDRLWAAKPRDVVSMRFVAFVLGSDEGRSALSSLAKGSSGSMKNITKLDVLDLPIVAPSAPEQQKIAECLSSVDEVIAAQARKLESLKAHKNGLRQQLFPREGETLPRLRFVEFRDAKEWKLQTISNILRRVSNPVKVDVNEVYRQIGIRSHGKGIFHKEPVKGKELGNKRVFWIEVNALVVNIVFAWEQAIAITSSAEYAMIASHRFPMYKSKGNISDVRFLKYFFLTPKGKYLLGVASPGGAGRNKTLGQKEFEKIELVLPQDLEEQRKIAWCLSSFDDAIDAQTKNIDALKTHKKGLMQQLFPSIAEADA